VKHFWPELRSEGASLVEPQQAAAQAVAASAADTWPPAPVGFEKFFRTSFPELVGTAMTAGATKEEGEDAVAQALEEMLPAWPVGDHALAYARRAVVHNFIKAKTRGPRRVAQRLVDRGYVQCQEGAEDSRLTALEDDAWVTDVLSILPPAQREVMTCIARGVHRDEIAETLGKTRGAVRRNLCDARTRLAEVLHPDGEHKQPERTTARATREEAP
jgi:DNA-directed RNA polymerase specialized sigma24 family protein